VVYTDGSSAIGWYANALVDLLQICLDAPSNEPLNRAPKKEGVSCPLRICWPVGILEMPLEGRTGPSSWIPT
jgi:hypothetical protein